MYPAVASGASALQRPKNEEHRWHGRPSGGPFPERDLGLSGVTGGQTALQSIIDVLILPFGESVACPGVLAPL